MINRVIENQNFQNIFVSDGLMLHSHCSENQQCTGRKNANQCITYGSQPQTCRCKAGYIEVNASCYKSKTSPVFHNNSYL